MSVIQFPTASKQIDALEERLTSMCDNLQEDYNSLYRLYEDTNTIEDRVSQNEKRYNDILKAYIQKVGVENCPVGFLEYSTNARATVDDHGNIVLFFEANDEKETP